MSIKFKQIAVAADANEGEILYALGEDGVIYEKSWKQVHQGQTRKAVYFWRALVMPMSEPMEAEGD